MTDCAHRASVWWIPHSGWVGCRPGVPLWVGSGLRDTRPAEAVALLGTAAHPPGSLRQQGLHLLLVAQRTRPVSLLPPGSVLEGGEHRERQSPTLVPATQKQSRDLMPTTVASFPCSAVIRVSVIFFGNGRLVKLDGIRGEDSFQGSALFIDREQCSEFKVK